MKADEFIEAFETYHENIYRFVYFKVNRNKQIAEDVTQDVFMKAWENRDSYDATKSNVRTWLYLISKRLVIDEYRKKSLPNITEEMLQIGNMSNEIEDHYLSKFAAIKMDLLNEQEKEIIILRYIEGFELVEIATIVNKNYDATKVACSRAIKKLQEIVNK